MAYWREDRVRYSYPGGENMVDVQKRVFGCYVSILKGHAGQAIVILSHGAALMTLISAMLGWDLADSMAHARARIGNTGVTVVKANTTTGKHEMLLLNSTKHLASPTGMESVMDPPVEVVTP